MLAPLILPSASLAADLDIQRSVLLSWPDNAAQEQIVVGADSLASNAVWTPWPEPIFKRHGELCMAVPTTASQQFFKLVPGTQFYDDFSDTMQPFTNRNAYTNFGQSAVELVIVTNGVMQIARVGPCPAGVSPRPPMEILARDFCASVDILNWTTSSTNWCYFSIAGRGRFTNPTAANAYIAGLVLNYAGIPGNVRLSIWNGSIDVPGPSFDFAAIPPPYRMEFSVVGNNLRLRVLNLATKEVIREQTLVAARFTEGWVGFWVNNPANDPTNHEIIVDNFFVTGTKP
jgi:hypothetical protein